MSELYVNPNCSICNGTKRVRTSVEEFATPHPTHAPVGEHLIEMIDLSLPRLSGWRLTLFLHGRQQLTIVEHCWFLLEGTKDPTAIDHEPVRVRKSQSPHGEITHLLGVYDLPPDQPRRTLEPNVIRVGGFLLMRNSDHPADIYYRMPIVHIVASWIPID